MGWLGKPPFWGFCEVRTVFIEVLRCHVLFPLFPCHTCTLEFPRGYTILGDTVWHLIECVLCILMFKRIFLLFVIWSISIDMTHIKQSFSQFLVVFTSVKGSRGQKFLRITDLENLVISCGNYLIKIYLSVYKWVYKVTNPYWIFFHVLCIHIVIFNKSS